MLNVSEAHKPDMSKPITNAMWQVIEQYYITEIDKIHIPEDPKPFDITSINSQLERVFHEARLDYFYANKAFGKVQDAYKKLKRAMYQSVKAGKNEAEREHLYQELFMSLTLDKLQPDIRDALGLPNIPTSIYTVYEGSKDRVDFLKTILDLISDKSGRLITDSGAMKIENNLTRS